MQILYGAPFILLSLICFAVSLSVPSLRRHAIPALIAPIAFGVCSLTGWIAFVLIGSLLPHLKFESAYLIAVAGLVGYCVPGLAGAWASIRFVRLLEQRFLDTRTARNLALRSILSLIACGIGFVIGLAVAVDQVPTFSALIAALANAGVFAGITFLAIMLLQRKLGKGVAGPRPRSAEQKLFTTAKD